MVANFPTFKPQSIDLNAEGQFETIMALIRVVRNIRAEFRIPPRKPIEVFVKPGKMKSLIEEHLSMIQNIGSIEPLTILSSASSPIPENSVTVVIGPITVSVPMGELIDIHREFERLNKELTVTEEKIDRLSQRMADPNFLSKAPEEVIQTERQRHSSMMERKGKIVDLLEHMRN